jgi:hypothetical protein
LAIASNLHQQLTVVEEKYLKMPVFLLTPVQYMKEFTFSH